MFMFPVIVIKAIQLKITDEIKLLTHLLSYLPTVQPWWLGGRAVV